MKAIGKRAREASFILATASSQSKDQALQFMAEGLRQNSQKILKENQKDLTQGQKKALPPALLDRLSLNEKRIEAMAGGLEEVMALADPVGQVLASSKRPNGLQIEKVRIPIGVIGIIYESRPNVTVDAAGLCIKAGNAVILRGGSESFHSNQCLAKILVEGLRKARLPEASVQVPATTDRTAINEMLQLDDCIDLIIPRGGEALIRHVTQHSRIPVLKHYKGVCHLYIDESADAKMAEEITLNAKVQRPGVCNAIETLLIHRSHEKTLLGKLIKALQKNKVEIRATPEIAMRCPDVKKVQEKDWSEEYLDLILSVKMVDSIEEAISHIQKYGSQHTESIITQSKERAEQFLKQLQSSVVLVNASTRFADGGQMGMGAEIGISTTKLHAFGPMGLEDLTIGHYRIRGQGQIRT
jgi:glutamate-5-semialdehyde dehydrogenase